ncbi:MAG: hypothetical protein AUK47_00665 [Deltaproteobacteria bacterium CG2_30_63_29]|nr:MAG: hypothetical protein AUK47_00665 [Deltaproteobacteria bacterium CG2_30_63_29]
MIAPGLNPHQLPVDLDTIRPLTDETSLREGIAAFRDGRVIDLEFGDEQNVTALVEDKVDAQRYGVELFRDSAGKLVALCECEEERSVDANHQGQLCAHLVGALLAFSSNLPVSESTIDNFAEQAIADRAKRGRSEVETKHLRGEPYFGTWSAHSIGTTTSKLGQRYKVQLRSLTERINLCTCPDFANNQLSTCKHIEAVLHTLRKTDAARFEAAERVKPRPPASFLYLSWDGEDGPTIKLVVGERWGSVLAATLDPFFDTDNSFVGSIPSDFFRLQRALRDRPLEESDGEWPEEAQMVVGDDVLDYVRRVSAEAVTQRDGRQIRDQIESSGGHLPHLHAKLYPYQVEGVAFLASKGRALLADDMGLGKTMQAIAASLWMMERRDVRRTVIVCPASLKHQWAREIEKFTSFTDEDLQIVQGTRTARMVQYRQKAPFTIMNYELVLRDCSAINALLAPDLLIIDEAQRIKNWRTKTATAVKTLKSRYAFVLTGTPLENRLEDLYSLMQLVDPQVLGPLWRYLLDFHVSDERGKVLGYRNLSELRSRLNPVMLRRDRRLVRDQLPERIENQLDIPMTSRQAELHASALSAASMLFNLSKRRPLTPSETHRLLAALQSARMACDAAGLVDKVSKGSPKLDELRNLLEEVCVEGGRKVVVFSEWKAMLDMAMEVADGLALKHVCLHGGVPTAKRGALLDRFRDDDACQLFFSTDAGGVGLNLQSASVLINLEVPWNPAVLEQRIARVHRLGQSESVQIFKLVAEGSYEEHVASLVHGKQHLFDNVITPDGVGVDTLGLNKSMLAQLEEILGGEPTASPNEEVLEVPAEALPAPDLVETTSYTSSTDDADLNALVAGLQAALGPRLQRVLAALGGIIAVVDQVEDDMESKIDSLPGPAVALMDLRTLLSLQKLRTPLAGVELLHTETTPPPSPRDLLVARASQKLTAAEALLHNALETEGIELLSTAMCMVMAARIGADDIPPPLQRAPWLYTTVAQHDVAPEQVAIVGRALGLAMVPAVPSALVSMVLDDARRMVRELGAS